jgi:hypothetical protein
LANFAPPSPDPVTVGYLFWILIFHFFLWSWSCSRSTAWMLDGTVQFPGNDPPFILFLFRFSKLNYNKLIKMIKVI